MRPRTRLCLLLFWELSCTASLPGAQERMTGKQGSPTRSGTQMGAETPVLCFERTGGYAGIHQSFLIYSDGRVFDVGGRLRTIPPGVARAFRLRFDTIGPSRSGRLGTRKGLCMDCFQYRISVWGMSGVKTFVLEEPFLETADSLARLARELRELLAGLRWK